MKRENKRQSEKLNTTDQQVEELLRAAQDDVVLNLSVNSHLSRVAPDYLPSDLDRRFRALKTPSTQSPPSASISRTEVKKEDLFTRFDALKGSTHSSSSSSDYYYQLNTTTDGDDDDDEDEVEKLIKWAVDAARLEPSPPSDDDDDDDDSASDEENGKEANVNVRKNDK